MEHFIEENKSYDYIGKSDCIFMMIEGQNRILLLLFVGVFMGSLDIGIVGPALPSIQLYFGVNERILSWVLREYHSFLHYWNTFNG